MKISSLPKGMIVVAAVVSFGMVGSQLDIGGLSGQAAGGESAGCGGDAYYDEDLGALVDSEGNVIDENAQGESADGSSEFSHVVQRSFDAKPAGTQMDGQSMVAIVEPNPALAAELADFGSEEGFSVTSDVANEGDYAVVGFYQKGFEELTHIQVLHNDRGEWMIVNELVATRDMPLSAHQLHIQHTTSNLVFFVAGHAGVIYNADTQEFTLMGSEEFQRELALTWGATEDELDGEEMPEAVKDAFWTNWDYRQARKFVVQRIPLNWVGDFVSFHFGAAEFELNTAVTNEVLVTLDDNRLVIMNACEFGAEPMMTEEGQLTCASCQDNDCINYLNREDIREFERDDRFQLRQTVRAELRDQGILRDLDLSGLAERLGLEKRSTDLAAAQDVYSSWSHIDNYSVAGLSGNTKILKRGCTIAFAGSDDGGDWAYNFLGVFYSRSVAGKSVHGGFADIYSRVAGKVASFASGCSNPKFIGHSLGGALATIAQLNNGGHVWTIGAPGPFKTNYGCIVPGTRYVAESDPVPHTMTRVAGLAHATPAIEQQWYYSWGWKFKTVNKGCNHGYWTAWKIWQHSSTNGDYYGRL